LLAKYVASGGPAALGFPLADDAGTAGGALVRLQGGDVYWSAATGAHVVRGAILDKWRSTGGQLGVLGYPTGDDKLTWGGGYETRFAGGTVYWSSATGAHMVRGAILQRYVANGGPAALGYPVADDEATESGDGARVRLLPGAIYWSVSSGAHAIRGEILDRWLRTGAQTGPYGYPVTDYTQLPDGSGYEVRFARGVMVEQNDHTVLQLLY
jgi:uncharacterized protein with LGFP repeats